MYRFTSQGLSLLGVAALGLATSCVPVEAPSVAGARARPITDARVLLQDLALTVPQDALAGVPRLAAGAEPIPSVSRAAPPFLAQPQTTEDGLRALDCLTAAIYYEARSQAPDGQRAVAQVVLNRVRDRAFPNSICGVVYQGSLRRTGCQFSFTCDGSMARPREPGAWDRARVIAQAALAGAVYAPVGAATFYHATSVMPWWAPSLSRVALIGSHIFYRWQGALGTALAFRQRYAGWEPAPQRGGGAPMVNVVRYGMEEGFSVTVHRGLGSEQAPAAVPAAAHIMVTSGVRVHYGAAPDVSAADEGVQPTELLSTS